MRERDELRGALDTDCACEHHIDDHGSELAGCYLCHDEGEPEPCRRPFLDLCADAVTPLLASAWGEGYQAGLDAYAGNMPDDWDSRTANPYRAAESPAESPGHTEAGSGSQGAREAALRELAPDRYERGDF